MTTESHNIRDGMIHNAVEKRRADETKILQKVNAANREAFMVKFPGMLEHSLRLVNERLMNCLNKPEGINLSDPNTWPAPPAEIANLVQALHSLNEIYLDWKPKDGDWR